jgi:hypothetical protein
MYPFEEFDAVEVWNGLWSSDRPWNANNDTALADWEQALTAGISTGRWQPAIGCSDTHQRGQIAIPHLVVRADELSSGAVLAGIRAGRSWVAGSPGVDLALDARAGDVAAGIGERLGTDGEPAVLCAVIGGVPSGTVSVHTDRGVVHCESLPAEGTATIEWRTSAQESAFVRVEVRDPEGQMAALTNPIILS